jgi:hypothetical protein
MEIRARPRGLIFMRFLNQKGVVYELNIEQRTR